MQIAPSNTAQSIRVLSPGDNGDLNQSNAATAGAAALNGNKTDQDTDQSQAGSGHGSDYSQVAGQEAKNDQDADADAKAVQVKPSNTASSIRVLSPGDDGEVEQTNSSTALAAALNANKTDQSIDQDQGGEKKAPYESEKSDGKKSDGGSSYSQVAGQEAKSDQDADADAKAVQVKPSNTASSIRVLSPGDDGDVEQTNAATAVGIAANVNKTDQSIDQEQPGGMSGGKYDDKKSHGSSYSQVAGQSAKNDQDADADAKAVQIKPSNTASSIRVLSKGDGGDVDQSNSTTAVAAALNLNKTDQSIDQDQSGAKKKAPYHEQEKSDGKKSDGGSSYSQIAGQSAKNDQDADADAKAVQVKPSNTASSIRVLSKGDDGDVEQTNAATSIGIAANVNKTDQSIDQDQSGHGQGSDYSQVAGQEAKNDQDADADAKAVQIKPSNTASSIRVLSPGDGGDVEQTNSTTALAAALNANKTDQSIDQDQGGEKKKSPYESEKSDGKKSDDGSSYTQIAGQSAKNDQDADADATAIQIKPSNTASSIRVLSKGDDGDVEQTNAATAVGIAANANKTDQSIDQDQGGAKKSPYREDEKSDGKKSGGSSDYLQVAGQEADSHQDADADAFALQLKPSNTNKSTRVLSRGDDGDVTQTNSTTAIAAALNLNKTDQSIDQDQTGGGHGGSYLQVAGQGAWNRQDADADAAAIQLGASNEHKPVRVKSKGGGGSVEQSNEVTGLALALNLNKTHQALEQEQSGKSPEYLQVAGQGSWSDQRGGAWLRAIQGGKNRKKH